MERNGIPDSKSNSTEEAMNPLNYASLEACQKWEEQKKLLTECDIARLSEWQSIATGQIAERGYHKFLIRNHPRANTKGYVKTSILMAEAVLGKPLPPNAVVHHIDGDGTYNASRNLVICENNSYHTYLHTRQRALEKSGNANLRPCVYCTEYDDPAKMTKIKTGYYHRDCMKRYCYHYNREVRKHG
jgi:hypothetical protein